MPVRRNTSFVQSCHADDLFNSPSPSTTTSMPGFKVVLQKMETRAIQASFDLNTAAAPANVGPIPAAFLELLNEAASDLGYIDDQLKKAAQDLNLPAMTTWAALVTASQQAIAPSFVVAQAAGAVIVAQNPGFDVAQLP